LSGFMVSFIRDAGDFKASSDSLENRNALIAHLRM